eukprot:c1898_g1_i1.p1 GENE.c1898_g1_i1~~c1898_g1_i1.p1  ORF type:complete len:256 (+),score=35.79 c1898_g1_i1:1786-2553(+)
MAMLAAVAVLLSFTLLRLYDGMQSLRVARDKDLTDAVPNISLEHAHALYKHSLFVSIGMLGLGIGSSCLIAYAPLVWGNPNAELNGTQAVSLILGCIGICAVIVVALGIKLQSADVALFASYLCFLLLGSQCAFFVESIHLYNAPRAVQDLGNDRTQFVSLALGALATCVVSGLLLALGSMSAAFVLERSSEPNKSSALPSSRRAGTSAAAASSSSASDGDALPLLPVSFSSKSGSPSSSSLEMITTSLSDSDTD